MGRRCIRFVCACALLTVTTAVAQGQSAEESAMAQQVASSIKASGQLSNYRLGVKYQDQVAWLLGTVASEEQRDKAIELAKQVDGVEQVICKLTIATEVKTEVKSLEAPAKVAPTQQLPRVRPAAALAPQPTARPVFARQPRGRTMPMPMQAQRPMAMNPAGRMAAPMQGRPVPASYQGGGMPGGGRGMGPSPAGYVPNGNAVGVSHDNAHMPGYAWPSYAAYPNYAAVTYPKQYSPTAWPYIGPFYPYPQVPLGWRKVTLEWDDGWWQLDFSHSKTQ